MATRVVVAVAAERAHLDYGLVHTVRPRGLEPLSASIQTRHRLSHTESPNTEDDKRTNNDDRGGYEISR